MTTTVRVLRSTDASAPTLNGVAGSLITLLDAALVNGYGASAPLGWTKAFSGTNKAAYKNSAVEGTGLYLRVQDDASGIAASKSQTTGYETMSTVDAGTNQFPLINPTYYGVIKSITADATNRPWVIIGNEYGFHLLIQEGTVAGDWTPYYFGDIISYKTSDPWKFVISSAYSNSQAWLNSNASMSVVVNIISTTITGFIIARDHLASVGAVLCGKHTDYAKAPYATIGNGVAGLMPYPAPVNNGVFLAPAWVHHGSAPYVVRGHIPGLWCPMHGKPIANNDTFSGTGSLAGKTFEAFNSYNAGQIMIETSNTWS